MHFSGRPPCDLHVVIEAPRPAPEDGRRNSITRRLSPITCFCALFSQPTYDQFVALAGAAILIQERRTVAMLLRTLEAITTGHRASYQRVLTEARWSGPELGCTLAEFLLRQPDPERPRRPRGA